jgi:mitotic spindle assembly checkpoint protein MAD2
LWVQPLSHNIRSILYQRGVYPADDFHLVKKYGQTVMLTEDAALVNYLDKILKQANGMAIVASCALT